MTSEKEDLENLLKHPGWLRLKAYATKHWQDEIATHLRAAVNDNNDLSALAKMRQIIVAKDAVERLMQWPEERLTHINNPQTIPLVPVGRGGYNRA